ncbi:polyketide beta-ketoacyl-synthase [Parahypoxylon ruwenzoriense]
MKPNNHGDILVFAGQGSKHHLSDRDGVDKLRRHLGEAKPVVKSFLKRCRQAFREEYGSLTPEEQTVLSNDIHYLFEDPDALIFPPRSVLLNPVFETIALYIRQTLELIVFGVNSDFHPRVAEVTGVCTGLLPAILAGSNSSYESDEFLHSAIQGFRLAFWIGVRSALFCRDVSGERYEESPWVLSTFGCPAREMETKLSEFCDQHQSKLDCPLKISAIFDNDIVSISGPGSALEDFKTTVIPPSIQCRLAHVHGYYHGGTRMEDMVERLLSDVKERKIEFPTWDSLYAPLRLSTTGIRMTKGINFQSLLETVLRSIFVDMCDWKRTRETLFDDVAEKLKHDPDARFRIVCVGPGTRSLVQAARNIAIAESIEIVDDVLRMSRESVTEGIAIVGLSVNYPSAKGLEELWDILENGRCSVSEIPPSRFDISRHDPSNTPSSKAAKKHSIKYGNFLEDPFQFDAGYFNISPREARSMDPQQRLLLQAALEALEDSGYAPDSTTSFQKDTMGVYVGVATGDYVDNLRGDIDVYYSPGTLRAFLSGRISYAFGFHGPSMVVDTACSSSLVAVYQACRALQNGECTAALAGGVNTISSPDMYLGLSRAHFLSPTGQCKPFDAAADGYCRSEGCGLVVLKKLSDAIEEGDHIYGVIRGIGINQCGTAKSITHPDQNTQAALFKQILRSSSIGADTISVVEAHGTGTQAGDYAEISSLNSVFGSRPATNPLHLCAIKGNIGHAEASSGIAGLSKLLLMMQKRKIPPQASFKTLNPRLADQIRNIVIPTQLLDWKSPSSRYPRRALLNNFGAAGSNAALILEEYAPRTGDDEIEELTTARSCHILNLSAKSEQAIALLRDRFISYIQDHPKIRIDDLCYSSDARRQEHARYRLSVTGSDLNQLLNSLRQSKSQTTTFPDENSRKTVFVFSGQGHTRKGMAAEMLSTIPEFRRAVRECDSILSQNGFPIVTPFLSDSSDSEIFRDMTDETIVTQCALFVLEYALAKTWMQWGVTPHVVLGHSIGEYAAMTIAGILDVDDALLLLAKRAKLIATKCVPGMSGMVSCRASADTVTAILSHSDQFDGIGIACLNSPEDVVVAGPAESLARFVAHCEDNGIKSRQLQVPYGFHSSAMDSIMEDFEACSSSIISHDSSVVVGSSSHGKLLSANANLGPSYFVRHMRDPVKFSDVIEDVERSFKENDLDFIEIGPSASTESMIRKTVKEMRYAFLPSLRPSEKPWVTLTSSLRSLFLRGRPVKWRDVYHGSSVKFLPSIPKYPLTPSQYLVPFKDPQFPKDERPDEPQPTPFEFLGLAKPKTSGHLTSFDTSMTSLSSFIKAHTVAGVPLCPASVLMEVAAEAVDTLHGTMNNGLYLFEDVVFEKPLVYAEHMENKSSLRTDLETKGTKEAYFSCLSQDQLHCAGHISRKSLSEAVDIFTRKQSYVKRLRRTMQADFGTASDSFSSMIIYQVIFPRVVAYSEPFLTLKQLTISESRLEGLGRFKLGTTASHGRFVCPPPFVDTLLHAAGFIANVYVPPEIACICVSLERAMLPTAEELREGEEMSIYCNLTDIGHSIVADSYVIDSDEKIVAFVEGACFKKIQLRSFNSHLSRLIREPTRRPSPPKAPDSSQQKIPLQQSQFFVENTIKSIVEEACGVSLETTNSTTLQDVGVDSLMLIEITQLIRNRLPHSEIDEAAIERCTTFQDLVDVVSKASAQASHPNSPPPEMTRTNSPAGSSIDLPQSLPQNISSVVSPMESLLFETCGIQVEDGMKDLELGTLGVDSLLSIELIDELQGRFGVVIDDSYESISNLTFHRLEALFDKKHQGLNPNLEPPFPQPSADPRLLHSTPTLDLTVGDFQRIIQRQIHGTPKSNVYVFHDGSGHCSMYSRVPDINRTINGIWSPDQLIIPSPKVDRLEQLASLYIKHANLMEQQEIILGGWSFGGVLAFEVSRQLRQLGRPVKGVVLIDSPLPVNHRALPQEVISYVVGERLSDISKNVSEASKQARDKINQKFYHHAMMLQNYHPQPQPGDVPCVMLKCSQIMDTDALCNVSYPWLSDEGFRERSVKQWEQLIGRQIPVLDLPCNHFQVFDPEFIHDFSEKFKLACDVLDSA